MTVFLRKLAAPTWWARHTVLNVRTRVTSCGTIGYILNLYLGLRGWLRLLWNFFLFADWKSDREAFWEQSTSHPRPRARRHTGRGQGWRIHSPADRWLFPTGARISRTSGTTHQWRSDTLILSYNWMHFAISQNGQVSSHSTRSLSCPSPVKSWTLAKLTYVLLNSHVVYQLSKDCLYWLLLLPTLAREAFYYSV